MKLKLIRTIVVLMKFSFYSIFLQCLFVNLLLATEISAQKVVSMRKVYVDLELNQHSLKETFDLIESKTNYKFNYSKVDLNRDIAFSKTYKRTAVSEILLDISREARLNFKQINLAINVGEARRRTPPKLEVQIYDIPISGNVIDENGEAIPGVNVIVKGTSTGAITDANGFYRVNVPDEESVLVFSSVGYVQQEIIVGSQSTINITLLADVRQLQELVVTAFGLEREKKALTYSAQNVEVADIAETKDLNVANQLIGKVAGLDLTKSTSGVGGSSRVLIRGNRSISSNNQPLYIVDGVPIDNTSITGAGDSGGQDSGDGISNINPDDMESITVLKGPSATALYGARGANGVIVITTKKGRSREGIGIQVNSNFQIEKPVFLMDYQNQYGQGNGGVYNKNAETSWGPRLDGSQVEHWSPDPNFAGPATYPYVAHPDNVEDFFRNGYNFTNSIALTGGNEKVQTYFSYTNTQSQGIVETNQLERHNVNFRITSRLTDKLTLDSKITYFNQKVDDRLSTGEGFANPLRAIYRMPRNISTAQAQVFEYTNAGGNNRQHYWNVGSNGGLNPYWMLHRVKQEDTRDRVLGFASLTYQFTDDLSLMIRSGVDRYFDDRVNIFYNDTYTIADRGNYLTRKNDLLELNNDFLLSYNKDFSDTWSISASLGGNLRVNDSDFRDTNNGFLTKENLFTVSNAGNLTSTEFLDGSPRLNAETRINSLYAFATIGYKNFLFVDLTGRNDWDSTLPKDEWSFFYPSIGTTLVLSDMFKALPDWLSFAKARVSWAKVGNGASPFLINPTYTFNGARGNNGTIRRDLTKPFPLLKPEETRSWEAGFDIRFFNNRLGLDFTWYKSNSENQLLKVPVPYGSTFQDQFINAGDIQNEGVEVMLNATPVDNTKFTWDVTVNWARNRSLVKELTDDVKEFSLRGAGFITDVKVVEGEQFGDIFGRGFERNANGQVIVGSDGRPLVTASRIPVGNYNPDWTGGITNTFSYKGINMSFLIDWRQGGEIVSFTAANLWGDGLTAQTLEGREGLIFDGVLEDGSPNNIEITAEELWTNIGGRNTPVAEAFVVSGTNIRLRQFSLGYSIPSSLYQKTPFTSIKLSLVGRNLFFLKNDADFLDPEAMIGNSNAQGVESFALPTTRSFGFNLNFTL
ncbi:SusC/RagA family TonB-linked outer membrane protein [Fulvivirgaceae bacterium BMA12]|uniref:SusC/RagA family TonB-linked outer membrane protein n=1 Tax=Agaribacillus aureus TaxID=3051825 RepID=A0ABT8LHR2_9BACT|nr:SusC/RagA family TonB-linked outer membrane protein [Fulvivirgaceae bacterium BMA12]